MFLPWRQPPLGRLEGLDRPAIGQLKHD